MKDILQYKFIDELKSLSFVERILLYGSRARGDNQRRSDIDLAIDCARANESDWQEVLNIIDNADSLLKIDCLRLDQLANSNKLKQNIIKEAEIIFERK